MRPEPDAWLHIDAAVEEFAGEQRWPVDLDFQIRMVLEELVLNILNHGKSQGESGIQLDISSDEKRVHIVLSDNGPGFDPLQDAPEPDLDSEVGDRPVGGLGVHLVRSMCDEVSYERHENRNQLTMTKYRDR